MRSGFHDKEKLEKAQAEVRANATPEQRAMMNAVDEAFEQEARAFDERLDAEGKIRKWAEALCGFKLDFTEIEALHSEVQKAKPGTSIHFVAKRGQVQVYKTVFGTVDTLQNYVGVLERTVIDVTNNSQFTPLPTSGLIKLAFKRLFKRSK